MFDDVASVALHSALDGLAMRQRAAADNIANIQTPGFLANRVMFEDALRSAVSGGDASQVRQVAPDVARSLEPTRMDGNNVNLDEETLSATKTSMSYELMLRAVDDRFNLVKSSMGK